MKALLVPIKDSARAKTRLAEVLSADERHRLVWAMFEDVTRAVLDAAAPDRVFIVTSFNPAIERARALGLGVIIEESQISESDSVDRASRALAEEGYSTVMRLPADLPLVRGRDIDELLSIELRAPAALLVPSREGTGTNAIIRTPPALFPSRFGPNSLALHKEEAARAGIHCQIVRNARIALDIDEPADIEALRRLGRHTHTYEVLAGMNIEARIGGYVS
jgi:2-phospho-L-lactate guanylyltransferase